MLLNKKKSPERKTWLEKKGNLAQFEQKENKIRRDNQREGS